MTVLFFADYNIECSGVTFENNGCIKVQKFDNISGREYNIKYLIPLKTILCKREVCDMTLMSGAFDKSVFDGNTVLLKISEEYGKHSYVYIGGDMICSFLTNDKIYKNISNMGSNLTPYSIAKGEENIYFLTPHFELIEKDKNNDNELLNTNESSVDPFDYHVSNCGIHSFKKLPIYRIHSNYDS